MKLATIRMDRRKAREAFLEYRRSLRDRHDEEDAAIMRGYRALANGQQLISLSDAIRRGGVVGRDDSRSVWDGAKYVRQTYTLHLPALAVCRADLKTVYVDTRPNSATFVPDPYYRGRRDRITVGDFDEVDSHTSNWAAMVPNVPASLRPKTHLRNFHILFEADWRRGRKPAPYDPALLKRIGGDLFAVLAVWNLTALERAVLGARGDV